MKPYQDSLDDSEDRSVDWKYTGRFLQFGELTYKLPSTGELSVGEIRYTKRQKYECVRRTTKNQMIDGFPPFLCLRIRNPYFAYCERICIHRATYSTCSLLSTCSRVLCVEFTCWFACIRIVLFVGLVDKDENPEDAALRELQEETGFIGKLSEVCTSLNVFLQCQFDIPYYSDPWKSNEQQRLFIVEIDVDEMANKSPHQQLEEDESISTVIVPISKLSEFIRCRITGFHLFIAEESKGIIVSTSIFFVASIMSNSFSL